jgi:hypothetical protein
MWDDSKGGGAGNLGGLPQDTGMSPEGIYFWRKIKLIK